MKWVCLQMISLGSLLIFINQSSTFTTAAAEKLNCISKNKVKNRTDTFRRKYWDKLRAYIPEELPSSDTRTCAQMAKEPHDSVNNRSLSPWKFELNQDDSRVPHKISFAKCLCQGCIINGLENMMYNSVLVHVELVVLKKKVCPHDPERYMVKKDVIKVPVACTCVVPKYAK